ncbi:hypothetical protein D3C71_2228350 [compost metagenome]
MAAIVERDDAVAGMGQRLGPLGVDPVGHVARGEAVHQHDRTMLIHLPGRGEGDIGDVHAVG